MFGPRLSCTELPWIAPCAWSSYLASMPSSPLSCTWLPKTSHRAVPSPIVIASCEAPVPLALLLCTSQPSTTMSLPPRITSPPFDEDATSQCRNVMCDAFDPNTPWVGELLTLMPSNRSHDLPS